MPKFSVIVPVFNSEATLKRSLFSVITQIFKDFEVIIIDDGSTDITPRILDEFRNQQRIRVIRQTNRGVCSARNLGANTALGDWLVFLDSDDELLENALKLFYNAISENPKNQVWFSGIRRISDTGVYEKIPQPGVYQARIPGTFCLKKSLFIQVGGYDPQIKFSENTELFHRIGLLDHKSGVIPEITVEYHESPYGGSKNLQNMIDSLSLILSKHEHTLSNKVKFLYHQIIGVNQMRFHRFSEARKHLCKAFLLRPYKTLTFARLFLSYIPFLAKKIYTPRIS